MAELIADKKRQGEPHMTVWKWTNIAAGDTFKPVKITQHDDVTMYVHDTLGGGTFTLLLSPEVETGSPSRFAAANSGGSALSIATTDLARVVDEGGSWFQPVLTGGAGVDATVYLVAK